MNTNLTKTNKKHKKYRTNIMMITWMNSFHYDIIWMPIIFYLFISFSFFLFFFSSIFGEIIWNHLLNLDVWTMIHFFCNVHRKPLQCILRTIRTYILWLLQVQSLGGYKLLWIQDHECTIITMIMVLYFCFCFFLRENYIFYDKLKINVDFQNKGK